MPDLLLIGVIGKAHGLRGDVNVKPFNPASELWAAGTDVYLVPGEDVPAEQDIVTSTNARTDRIARVRPGAKGWLTLALAGCRDRTGAEALRSTFIAIPVDAMTDDAALGDAEFFFHEVAGWSVATPDGAVVGTIVRAVETYATLFEVSPSGGGPTFFVPVVGEIVVTIDRAAGRIVVDPPEGLLP